RHFFNVAGASDRLVIRELPLALPMVRVDALWHRRTHASPAHGWLRQTLVRAAGDALARSQREHPAPEPRVEPA
ncbi:MAG: LysR family transcriptional regulator, partial [Variovorax sp.]|nr:LysR family transcriptional regulator [Variovorax sp.]